MKTKLYLTVSRDGYISLWDHPGASNHGAVVNLELTPEQVERIRRAMLRTRTSIGPLYTPGPYHRLLNQ